MKELCIDDQVVEAIDNLARKLHQRKKLARNVASRARP